MRRWPRVPRTRWEDWANVILGAWLFISPWVLHTVSVYAASPGDFWWVGGAVFVLALWAIGAPWARWTEWITAALAIWLFVSPWVLGFSHVPRVAWDAWAVGVLVFLLSIWSLSATRPTLRGRLRPLRGVRLSRRRHPSSPTH